ncbi:MAG: 3-hydroxyanthranilate 3,4-dioxygenase [Myxococcota bacterium]
MKMPINLRDWVEENRELLKPPVGNKKIYEDQDFMIFVVGGPNARKDYHIDPSEEFFYQLEGEMTLKIVEDGEHKDIKIKAGEIFLLPSMVPHSPQRPANTVGLVIEHKRAEGANDGLRWYCDSCGEVLHEEFFYLTDIVGQLKAAIADFTADDDKRTCSNCGAYLEM